MAGSLSELCTRSLQRFISYSAELPASALIPTEVSGPVSCDSVTVFLSLQFWGQWFSLRPQFSDRSKKRCWFLGCKKFFLWGRTGMTTSKILACWLETRVRGPFDMSWAETGMKRRSCGGRNGWGCFSGQVSGTFKGPEAAAACCGGQRGWMSVKAEGGYGWLWNCLSCKIIVVCEFTILQPVLFHLIHCFISVLLFYEWLYCG